MTQDNIIEWIKINPRPVVFNIMHNAAIAYSNLPSILQRGGADLVLLELEILCHEWKSRKGETVAA